MTSNQSFSGLDKADEYSDRFLIEKEYYGLKEV